MYKIKVLENQSLFDVAMQEHGTIETIFDILNANPGKITGIDITLPQGLSINIPEQSDIPALAVNLPVMGLYKKKQIKVTTAKCVSTFLLAEDGSFILQENGQPIITKN